MESTIKLCMTTFVHDTHCLQQFKDILEFLKDYKVFQNSYITRMARKLILEGKVRSEIMLYLATLVCEDPHSPPNVLFERIYEQQEESNFELPKMLPWSLKNVNLVRQIGKVFYNQFWIDCDHFQFSL